MEGSCPALCLELTVASHWQTRPEHLGVAANQRVVSASMLIAPNFRKESSQLESGQNNEVRFFGSASYTSDANSETAKISMTEPGIGGT